MTKKEFLQELRRALRCYGSYEVEGIIRYYDEIISDNIDTGLSERQAVAALGDVRDIVACIKAEMVETRMTKHERHESRPISGFFSLVRLCTSPVLLILAFGFTLAYLIMFVTFLAVGISIFAGGVGVLIMTVVNAIYAYSQIGTAGILISVGLGAFSASVMCLLGIGLFKLSVYLLKGFTKLFAKTVGNSKRKNIHYERQGGAI